EPGLPPRRPNQGRVPGVEGTHRRYKPDGSATTPGRGDGGTDLGDRYEDGRHRSSGSSNYGRAPDGSYPSDFVRSIRKYECVSTPFNPNSSASFNSSDWASSARGGSHRISSST